MRDYLYKVSYNKFHSDIITISFPNVDKVKRVFRYGNIEKTFTTKSPEILGTHLIDPGTMKGWVNLGVTQ